MIFSRSLPKLKHLETTPKAEATPIHTVPTGFSSVPPLGPAMPVVATPDPVAVHVHQAAAALAEHVEMAVAPRVVRHVLVLGDALGVQILPHAALRREALQVAVHGGAAHPLAPVLHGKDVLGNQMCEFIDLIVQCRMKHLGILMSATQPQAPIPVVMMTRFS